MEQANFGKDQSNQSNNQQNQTNQSRDPQRAVDPDAKQASEKKMNQGMGDKASSQGMGDKAKFAGAFPDKSLNTPSAKTGKSEDEKIGLKADEDEDEKKISDKSAKKDQQRRTA